MPPDLSLAASLVADPAAALVGLPIRVVLADDHALMRRGLRLLLDHEQDFEVVAEAGDLASVECEVRRLRPRVLVLDLRMPGGSSIELIGRVGRVVPQTGIVVSTMERNPGFARRALAAGGLGFVIKELADTELPEAVRAVARDREYVSPGVADRLEPPTNWQRREPAG